MYRAALRACALAGRGEEARALVREMASKGHVVMETDTATVMDALVNGGRPLEAVEMLGQAQRGVKPGLACYNAGVKAWAAMGRAAEAVALLGHMCTHPDTAPSPDVVSFNTALLACARAGDWRLALDLVRLMERLHHPHHPSVPPAPRFLNTTTAPPPVGSRSSTSTSASTSIAVGIVDAPLQQHQQHAPSSSTSQAPLFVPSSPLSVPLLLSSSSNHRPTVVQPSLTTYNTLLQSLIRAQPPQPLLALGLFDSLHNSSSSASSSSCSSDQLQPDAISFNLAIIAAGQGTCCQRMHTSKHTRT